MWSVTKPLTALEVKKAKPSESVYHLYGRWRPDASGFAEREEDVAVPVQGKR